jgi:hypothetical protein
MSSSAAVRRMIWSAVFLSAAVASVVTAGENAESNPPTNHSLSESIWYDEELEKVVPVKVKPIVDDSLNRQSRWLPKAQRVAAPQSTAGGGGGNGFFGSGLTLVNVLGWILLIAILGLAIGGLAYALSKAEIDGNRNSRPVGHRRSDLPDEQTIQRMKHLPSELRRTDVNLRSEAQRLQGDGHYDQAIILLFGHQLLLLDQVGVLRLNRGKTNRKYVRETRAVDPEAAPLLGGTVTAFERSYFGRHLISHDEFDQLWLGNLQLEQMADRRREAAA